MNIYNSTSRTINTELERNLYGSYGAYSWFYNTYLMYFVSAHISNLTFAAFLGIPMFFLSPFMILYSMVNVIPNTISW